VFLQNADRQTYSEAIGREPANLVVILISPTLVEVDLIPILSRRRKYTVGLPEAVSLPEAVFPSIFV
jgi:hypothetical protein